MYVTGYLAIKCKPANCVTGYLAIICKPANWCHLLYSLVGASFSQVKVSEMDKSCTIIVSSGYS